MKQPFKRAAVISFVSALLAICAQPAICSTHLDERNKALIAAIKLNDTKKVVTLLKQGANANTRYTPMTIDQISTAIDQNVWPLPPKHSKVNRGAISIPALVVALDIYLECPSDVRLPPKDCKLTTALIKAGADVNAKGREGEIPLLLAINQNRRDIATLLIERHANIFAKDDYSNTTLMAAAETGNTELVSYLLSHGIDINAKNKYGFTTLMSAFNGRTKPDYALVKMLLDHGADATARDKGGDTASTIAKRWSDPSVPGAKQWKDSKVLALLEQAEKEQRERSKAKH